MPVYRISGSFFVFIILFSLLNTSLSINASSESKNNKYLPFDTKIPLFLEAPCLRLVLFEIILIDNSLQGFEYNSDKLRIIIPNENLFVNPSWNLGVEKAKFDYVGILNDDIFQFGQLCIYLIVMTRKDSYIILGGTFTVQ